jgi:hypothetical protein
VVKPIWRRIYVQSSKTIFCETNALTVCYCCPFCRKIKQNIILIKDFIFTEFLCPKYEVSRDFMPQDLHQMTKLLANYQI